MALDEISADDAVIVALGSNRESEFGSPGATVEAALVALAEHKIKVLARSRLWRSRAWPDPTTGDFINAVAVVETALAPSALLATLHWIEQRFGRTRLVANAPRTLDLDLIAYGRVVSPEPPVLPHPRAAERRFVMGPLAEIMPGWRHPVSGEGALELTATASVGRDAKVVGPPRPSTSSG